MRAIVVGAGLVGAVQALLLAKSGCKVTVVEQRSFRSKWDAANPLSDRTVALSGRSIQLLDQSGLWPAIPACPIKTVHVSEQGKFGSVKIKAEKLNMDALGYVVSNAAFESYLHQCLRAATEIELIEGASVASIQHDKKNVSLKVEMQGANKTIDAEVLIAADGTGSVSRSLLGIEVEERDYHQCAVLANVSTSAPHGFNAFERFTRDGPLALLPLEEFVETGQVRLGQPSKLDSGELDPGKPDSGKPDSGNLGSDKLWSLIFTSAEKDAAELKDMPDSQFLNLLQEKFGGRLGRFDRIGSRVVTPLKLTVCSEQTLGRCVLIGNAARTLHPVAGQGLNLALRDVFELASCLVATDNADVCRALESFVSKRRRDQWVITRQTDILARVFTDTLPFQLPVSAARHASLLLLDHVDPLKKTFATLNLGQHVPLPH